MRRGSAEYEACITETFWVLLRYYNARGCAPDAVKLNRMAKIAVDLAITQAKGGGNRGVEE